MADIRSRFNLPVDEDFVLSDYPTLNHMIAYIQSMTGMSVDVQPAQVSEPEEVNPAVVEEETKPIT